MDNDPEVQQLIDRFGIRSRCVMTGMLASTSQCYSAMDVFFLPSLYEGLSVSVIEAQASGLECIVSDKISREHAVSKHIRFLSISDAVQVAKAVCESKNDCLDARASATIDDRYDVRQVADKLYRFYLGHKR